MGGETKYPVDYENHFTEFFCVYLRAECHKYSSANYIIFHQLR
jgi:hypothetical protein